MKLIIPGRLPGLNEYIDAERNNRYRAAKLKADAETLVLAIARKQLRGWRAKGPVVMHYLWVEKDRRRDKDNVSGYGRKVIQDALVKGKYLPNDNWQWISSFEDAFAVDKLHPRIEVEIIEGDGTWE